MSVRNQLQIDEVKRQSNERRPLFYFISFTTLCSPLTDIVIVHIVYINETIPLPPPLCDAVGGAFYYLVLRMQNPCRRQAIIITLGANVTTCWRQAIYILVSIHPFLLPFMIATP